MASWPAFGLVAPWCQLVEVARVGWGERSESPSIPELADDGFSLRLTHPAIHRWFPMPRTAVPLPVSPDAAPPWWKGIGLRQIRLTCALVLFTYLVSHLLNHALGNISMDALQS